MQYYYHSSGKLIEEVFPVYSLLSATSLKNRHSSLQPFIGYKFEKQALLYKEQEELLAVFRLPESMNQLES